MKRFYIIFFVLCLLSSAMLYLSVWWLLAALALCTIVVAYRYYAGRLGSVESRNDTLQQQMEQLHAQLDNSILKEQRSGREAELVKQAKHEILATMSHEIRTPMNGVVSMAMLLSETTLTREQRDYAETIRSCAESLLVTVNDILVNDILHFSKLDREGRQLEDKEFDLRNCLEEVLGLFALKARAEGLDLLYYMEEDVPEQVMGDSKRLRQVLMNLVENAVKFTPLGEVFVRVHTEISGTGNRLESPGTGLPQLCFEVRDSGIGMGEDQLKQVFKGIPGKEPHKEEDLVTTGLGLVICRTLVEFMGGQIEAKSQPGVGSTFSFTIPLSPGQKVKHNRGMQDLMASLEGKHILVVEHNATSLHFLVKQMRYWKLLPVASISGKQAMEFLSQHAGFDLVVTAMDMPEMNGIQLAKVIRDQYPELPVILMHGAGDERYRQHSELFSSVLVKPLRQYMLRDHILGIFTHTDKLTSNKQNPMSELPENFSERYPLRILVAEDNVINQKIASKILGKLGYQPELARNGKEVLEMVSHEHFDLILMDVQMPEMDGLEATRMLRICLEIQPVIIAMTANAMLGDRDDCMQSGMDDYISKPIEVKELVGMLEKWGHVVRAKKQAAA
jgi:signal transduction histidine kinase/DNA-binding response OmpR family regulator